MEKQRDGKRLRQVVETDADGICLGQYLRQRLNFTKAQVSGMKFRKEGLTVNGERVRVKIGRAHV